MCKIATHKQTENWNSLNAGQNCCRVLQWKNSAILLTSIRLQFVDKIFVLSILSGHFTQVVL